MHPFVARYINCLFLFPFALIFYAVAVAQSPPPEIRFKHFSNEQGLSQSTVNAVLQDKQGFIWLGTQDGLNRYDGYGFRVFRHSIRDSTSISDSYITCLLEDPESNLWVGTYSGGVNVLDRSRAHVRHIVRGPAAGGGLSGNSIMDMVEDQAGNIWVAVWNNGVNRYDRRSRTWTHFSPDSLRPGSLCDARVRSLLVDRRGNLWVCTFGGLDRFDSATQQFIHFRSVPPDSPGLRDNRVTCAFEDQDGDLWFGTFEHGIAVYDPRRSSFVRNFTAGTGTGALSSDRIVQICQAADSTIWIATWDGGVNRLDKASGRIWIDRQTDDDPYCLSADQLRSMYKDGKDGIWIGTDGAGVNHYDPGRFRFRHLRHIKNNSQGLGNPFVRSLCEDRSGVLWIGTLGGLDSYDLQTGRYEHYGFRRGKATSLSSDLVMAVLEDRDGQLWVGTDGGGLNRFNRKTGTFTVIRSDPKDPTTPGSDYIMTLYEGRDGALWIGTTGGGLTRMDRRTLACQRFRRTKDSPDQLSGNYIYAIHEDPDGWLWLGTWGAGITVLNPRTNQVRVYRHDPSNMSSLSHNTIHAFRRDRQGNLWIATMGGGLERYDSASDGFVHLTEDDGLPNDVLYGIEEDRSGCLWISSNNGLTCFDPKTQSFRNFGASDGLQSLEFNQGAYSRGTEGRLYFGGINGVNIIIPDQPPAPAHVAPVAITQIRVMDRDVPNNDIPGAILQLAYDENYLSFTFSLLDFTAPEQNTYRYMLEGLTKSWINAGVRNYGAYTDVQPGEYVFRVQGRNRDGEWSAGAAPVRIQVQPPFWSTYWFRALVLAAAIGMALGFYRNRLRRLRREKTAQSEFSRKLIESQENERKRIAGELHDSLGQNLLTIKNRLGRCEAGAFPGDVLGRELGEISAAVQHTIEDVREISGALHPHMLERLGLTRTIEATVKKCAASAGLSIRATVDNVDRLFSADEEINIFRIIQEGMNNVVKHSRASECHIAIQKTDVTCELTIEDDGCGFVPAQPGIVHETYGGFGLMHMAERVRLLHGSMDIISSPGKGTTLRISLPCSTDRIGRSS